MKKFLKSILIIFTIVLVGALFLVVSQYNNIKALIYSYQLSDEDITIKIEENNNTLENYISKYEKYIPTDEKISPSIVDTSPKQEAAKSKTEDNITNNTQEKTTSDNNETKPEKTKDAATEKNTDNTAEAATEKIENKQAVKTEDEIISSYVSVMYSLKNEFVTLLKELETKVYKEYLEIPKEERDLDSKKDLVLKYYDYVANLEKDCDKKVEDTLNKLKSELKEINADTAIIKDIKAIYENEKVLQKAYYIGLLNN